MKSLKMTVSIKFGSLEHEADTDGKSPRGQISENYELTYENKAGKEKVYEIVSFRNLNKAEELGERVTGLSIVAICCGKMLLLKEFRMGVNERIFNLCAGMLEKGKTLRNASAGSFMKKRDFP